jgi:hypothetical protein
LVRTVRSGSAVVRRIARHEPSTRYLLTYTPTNQRVEHRLGVVGRAGGGAEGPREGDDQHAVGRPQVLHEPGDRVAQEADAVRDALAAVD